MIIGKVSCGERPRRPSSKLIPDRIWEMLQACWGEDPTQRLTLERIVIMCTIHTAQNPVGTCPLPLRDCPFYFRDNPSFSARGTNFRCVPVFPSCLPAVYHHPDLPRVRKRNLSLHYAVRQPSLARGERRPNRWEEWGQEGPNSGARGLGLPEDNKSRGRSPSRAWPLASSFGT